MLRSTRRGLLPLILSCLLVLAGASTALAQVSVPGAVSTEAAEGRDARVDLKPSTRGATGRGEVDGRQLPQFTDEDLAARSRPQPVREPDEFERFVSDLAGIGPDGKPLMIRRYGAELRDGQGRQFDMVLLPDPMPQVPADYVVQPGDELHLSLWGSVDADLRLKVDRRGTIVVPRIGSVVVAGARQAELAERIRKRVAGTFRNFDLSVTVGELRPIRVFVTGFVARPGAYVVGGLATISQAVLKAGGPAPSGSLREITLRRPGQRPQRFDMYELLLAGDRGTDLRLQPDDVVHIGPVGIQAAIIGSVNQPAIYELRTGETVSDLMRMAGGLSPVADIHRLTLERLEDRDKVRVTELLLPAGQTQPVRQGDVLRAISAVAADGSQVPRNKRVRVEGEVQRPGTYVLPPASTLQDAIAAAGGLMPTAYVYGTEFTRESVRRGQQENYARALRDMEVEFARAAAGQRASNADEAASQTQRASASTRLIERLRAVQPNGRVVLEVAPDAAVLPPMLVEDGDRLLVPARATSVGVFGSVFSTGNYLFSAQRQLGDYLRLAGGPTRGADEDSVFVIRANGTVVSARQSSGWFSCGTLRSEPALPGDTIFVPEEINRTTFLQSAKDWTQVLYQFGLGVAAFKSLSN